MWKIWGLHYTEKNCRNNFKKSYEYQYSGKKYKSKREPLNDTWSSDIGDSSSAVVGINPGSEIIIFINPKKPKQSVLKKGYRGRHLKELFALFLFALTVELFSK